MNLFKRKRHFINSAGIVISKEQRDKTTNSLIFERITSYASKLP
jgi:hypothetical protein